MSLEDNKAIVRSLFERVVNDQDFELADRIIDPAYVDRSARPGSVARGPESLRDFVARQRAAFPNVRVSVEELIAEGDRVAARICMNSEPAHGGAPVRIRGTVWWRVADGKIVERWGAAFQRGQA
jgi:predicted ester cyclase